MFRFLIYMVRIRRVEFRIAEVPIVAIPVLLTVRDLTPIKSFTFWEGVFIFFLLFAFGDMINCLADRDLDAIYKPHLSEAVYGLGVPFVTFQVVATACAAILLSAHLAWRLNRWPLCPLVVIGIALGAAYSVKPIQLKSRGLAQLFCLWLIIFVGPMLFIAMLVDALPTNTVIAFAATYGMAQMGIILVNTAEDYPEDLNASITTTIVALGLKRGITLAFWLTLIGASGALLTLAMIFQQRSAGIKTFSALLPVLVACAFTAASIGKLKSSIASDSLVGSIEKVKRAGKLVPLWVTLVAWSSLAAVFVLFYTTK